MIHFGLGTLGPGMLLGILGVGLRTLLRTFGLRPTTSEAAPSAKAEALAKPKEEVSSSSGAETLPVSAVTLEGPPGLSAPKAKPKAKATWGSNGFLNFLFSPRSALLMLLFGLMIRRQQGLPDFVHTAMVTTLGMRLSWRRWNELLQNANVWNRRYADFFVAMAGTLSRISRMRGLCSPW